MDEQRARLILQAYLPGAEQDDPEVAAALVEAERDQELGHWFAEEQAFDRAISAHLEAVPAPLGLKTRILANSAATAEGPRSWSWIVKLAGVAAVLFLLFQVVSLFRTPERATAEVGYFSSEMVSFIEISPRLEMMSDDLGEIKQFLAKNDTAQMKVPPHLAALEPIGCRVLSYRREKVTLICFQRKEDGLAHLFVVDGAALPEMKPGQKPIIAQEGEWATATWAENDSVYLVTVQGGPTAVQRYLPST